MLVLVCVCVCVSVSVSEKRDRERHEKEKKEKTKNMCRSAQKTSLLLSSSEISAHILLHLRDFLRSSDSFLLLQQLLQQPLQQPQ